MRKLEQLICECILDLAALFFLVQTRQQECRNMEKLMIIDRNRRSIDSLTSQTLVVMVRWDY